MSGEKLIIPVLCLILAYVLNINAMAENRREEAVFGGGCYWCLEAVYQRVKGVEKVVSGFSGGTVKNPSYKEVCTGNTGHAEVVKITYDPEVVSYEVLLGIFFGTHDPTTLNRQGEDIGTQYRSVIFYLDEGQRDAAAAYIKELTREGIYSNPIVTQLQPLQEFYKAEDYHDNYFNNNPNQPYCSAVIAPKVAKFRVKYANWLKD
jgi:peptide-methionine (S)-S-oxide reductase